MEQRSIVQIYSEKGRTSVHINGIEIKNIISLELNQEHKNPPVLKLEIDPDILTIDTDFLPDYIIPQGSEKHHEE